MSEKFSTAEAYKAIGVSRRTFLRWLQQYPVEREVVFGETGRTYMYSRDALQELVRRARGDAAAENVAPPGAPCPDGATAQPAHPEHDETCHDETEGATDQGLALPPAGHVAEFLDLLADLRDVVQRAAVKDGEVGALREEVRQLREVLVARLPGPPAPPSPPPKFRPRVVAEVVLLGMVGLLSLALVGLVVYLASERGVIPPISWPWW